MSLIFFCDPNSKICFQCRVLAILARASSDRASPIRRHGSARPLTCCIISDWRRFVRSPVRCRLPEGKGVRKSRGNRVHAACYKTGALFSGGGGASPIFSIFRAAGFEHRKCPHYSLFDPAISRAFRMPHSS